MERRHQDGSQLLGPCVWWIVVLLLEWGRWVGGWVCSIKRSFFDHVDFEACVRHTGRDI